MVSPFADFALLLAAGLVGFWLLYKSVDFFDHL